MKEVTPRGPGRRGGEQYRQRQGLLVDERGGRGTQQHAGGEGRDEGGTSVLQREYRGERDRGR